MAFDAVCEISVVTKGFHRSLPDRSAMRRALDSSPNRIRTMSFRPLVDGIRRGARAGSPIRIRQAFHKSSGGGVGLAGGCPRIHQQAVARSPSGSQGFQEA
jgi:hypothetical protein